MLFGVQHTGETLVYVAGRKKQGKSTFMRAHVIAMAREGYRFVVWDSTGEWTSERGILRLPSTRFSAIDAAHVALESAPCTLVVDEIDRVCKPSPAQLKPDVFNEIVQCGRHYRVGLFCASRRPTKVHSDIPGLADAFVFFALTSPGDKRWLREQDDVSDELEGEVSQLGQGEYVLLRPGAPEQRVEATITRGKTTKAA